MAENSHTSARADDGWSDECEAERREIENLVERIHELEQEVENMWFSEQIEAGPRTKKAEQLDRVLDHLYKAKDELQTED